MDGRTAAFFKNRVRDVKGTDVITVDRIGPVVVEVSVVDDDFSFGIRPDGNRAGTDDDIVNRER